MTDKDCDACSWRVQEYEGRWHCEAPGEYPCPLKTLGEVLLDLE